MTLESSEPVDKYNMGEEHPAFKKAKSLPEPLRSHFPKNVGEANTWERHTTYMALSSKVLVVATTRIECAWCAYCDAVPGMSHRAEWEEVLRRGAKLDEKVALALFPQFEGVPYAW